MVHEASGGGWWCASGHWATDAFCTRCGEPRPLPARDVGQRVDSRPAGSPGSPSSPSPPPPVSAGQPPPPPISVQILPASTPRKRVFALVVASLTLTVVAGAVVIALVMQRHDKARDDRTQTTEEGAAATEELPMFDPQASQTAVVESIRADFCIGEPYGVHGPFPPEDKVFLRCHGPTGEAGDIPRFEVWPDPSSLEQGWSSSDINCLDGVAEDYIAGSVAGPVTVIGPSWVAALDTSFGTESLDALLDGGARIATPKDCDVISF